MIEAKLISIDGSTELNVMQNYMGQGRPGFSVRYIEDSGAVVTAEFPLEPQALGAIVNLLVGGQSTMLNHLFDEMKKAMLDAEEEINAELRDSSVLPFKRR